MSHLWYCRLIIVLLKGYFTSGSFTFTYTSTHTRIKHQPWHVSTRTRRQNCLDSTIFTINQTILDLTSFPVKLRNACTTVVNKNTQEQQDSAQEFCQTLFDSAKLQNEFSTKTKRNKQFHIQRVTHVFSYPLFNILFHFLLNWKDLNQTFYLYILILSYRIDWTELNWTELNRIEPNWTELNWIELNWIELN